MCGQISQVILEPESFGIEVTWENSDDLYDLRYKALDALYECLKTQSKECVSVYLESLQRQEQHEELLEGVLKRILNQIRQGGIENIQRVQEAVWALDALLDFDFVQDFFFAESRLFNQFQSGYQLEQRTIFGQILAINMFPDENLKWEFLFREANSYNLDYFQQQVRAYRERVVQLIDQFGLLLVKVCKNARSAERVRVWIEHSIVLNFGKLKTYQNHNQISSNSYVINLLRLMLTFSQEYFYNLHTIQETLLCTDLTQLFTAPQYLKDLTQVSTNDATFDAKIRTRVKKSLVEPRLQNLDTTFVVKVLLGLFNLATPCLQGYLKEVYNLMKVKNKSMYGMFFQDMQGRKLAYDIQFEDPFLAKMIIHFFSFEAALALHLNNLSFSTETGSVNFQHIEDRCSSQFAVVPICLIEDMTTWVGFLKQTHEPTLEKQQVYFSLVFSFFILVSNFRSWMSNPHLRLKITEEIYTMSPQTCQFEDYKQNQFSYLFMGNEVCNQFLISSLLRRYTERERLECEGESGSNQRLLQTFRFCQILGFLVSMKEFSDMFTKFAQESREEFLEFSTVYLKNLLNGLKDYVRCREAYNAMRQQTQNNSYELPENVFLKSQIASQQAQLRLMETFITTYIENMHIVTSYSKEAFLMDEIIDNSAQVINAIYWALEGQEVPAKPPATGAALQPGSAPGGSSSEPQCSRFNPMNLIFQNCDMFFIACRNPNFMHSLVNDIEFFSLERVQRCMQRVLTMKERKEKMAELIQRLREIESLNQLQDKLADQAPPEFLDPIMGSFMKNPVRLQTSGVVMDKVTILKHMLTDKTDPYNRKPITYDQIEEQDELRTQIQNYISQSMTKKTPPKHKKKKFSCFG